MVSNKLQFLRLNICNSLQTVGWIQRICADACGCELDALRLRELDVVGSQVVLRLLQANVELPRHRSVNVPVGQVPLAFLLVNLLVSMQFRNGSYLKWVILRILVTYHQYL